MSAALQLLPWIGSTYDVPQLRVWRASAERLSAGILTGIDYPSPEHVSHLLSVLLDAMQYINDDQRHSETCEGDLLGALDALGGAIECLNGERDDETKRADAAEEASTLLEGRATAAETERDELKEENDRLRAALASVLSTAQAAMVRG